jgi:hypothetical protein
MGIGRLFQCLLVNFVGLRQVLILALDFSSGLLMNCKGAFHKIPCGHTPLKVMIMSQKWPPSTLRTVSSQNSPTRNGALRKCYNPFTCESGRASGKKLIELNS